MAEQYLKIAPLDTLFFKDAKPFSWGEETSADGIFPPYPSVFFGAINTAYASTKGLDKKTMVENAERKLKIRGIYTLFEGVRARVKGVFMPLPSDLVELKGKSQGKIAEEKFRRYTGFTKLKYYTGFEEILGGRIIGNQSNSRSVFGPEDLGTEVEKVKDGLLTLRDFKDYLTENLEEEILGQKISSLVVDEPKIGIGRDDDTHGAEVGKLYRVPMQRASNLSFIVKIEGLDFSDIPHGVLKLGGEGKAAEYSLLTRDTANRLFYFLNWQPEETNHFKLYLATPTFFDPQNSRLSEIMDANVKLLGQCSLKPLPIGGYDLAKNRPKALRRAFPAGSVFVYKADKQISLAKYQGISISDSLANQGFGISYFINLQNQLT